MFFDKKPRRLRDRNTPSVSEIMNPVYRPMDFRRLIKGVQTGAMLAITAFSGMFMSGMILLDPTVDAGDVNSEFTEVKIATMSGHMIRSNGTRFYGTGSIMRTGIGSSYRCMYMDNDGRITVTDFL